MLYIKKDVTADQLAKHGFKRCKKPYPGYYLCVARGVQIIFIGDGIFVDDWHINDDPRVHKRPNCKYKSNKTVIDVIYDLIMDGLVEKKEIGE